MSKRIVLKMPVRLQGRSKLYFGVPGMPHETTLCIFDQLRPAQLISFPISNEFEDEALRLIEEDYNEYTINDKYTFELVLRRIKKSSKGVK